MAQSQLTTQPPSTPSFLLSYPAPHVLLIAINRPKGMNSLPYASHWEADTLLTWFETEPHLRVAILTGSGPRAFCAGQDLLEQNEIASKAAAGESLDPRLLRHPPSGFCGISRRDGKKPVIAAVNGYAFGGGFEICLGCDLIVAGPSAKFALPEAQRGLYAAAGGLSRLVRLVGITVASEVAMAGRVLDASEAERYGIANRVAASDASLVQEAVEMASRVASQSPDAIIVTRAGLREALEEGSVERATQRTEGRYGESLRRGENIRIGLGAFAAKKRPEWVASKL